MIKVKLLPSAWNDLTTIEDWYTVEFSKSSAQKVVNNILKSQERLELFPYSGSLLPDEKLAKLGYKMVLSGEFASVYKLINNEIIIYRVVNTRTQYSKLFYFTHK